MTVITTQYEMAWGKKPRGSGTWYFFNQKEDWEYIFRGTFREAKMAAQAVAKAAGINIIKVGS